MGNMEVFNPDFPQAQTPRGKKGIFSFSPKFPVESFWGQSGVKTPHFPHGFPLAWAAATQAKGNQNED